MRSAGVCLAVKTNSSIRTAKRVRLAEGDAREVLHVNCKSS